MKNDAVLKVEQLWSRGSLSLLQYNLPQQVRKAMTDFFSKYILVKTINVSRILHLINIPVVQSHKSFNDSYILASVP